MLRLQRSLAVAAVLLLAPAALAAGGEARFVVTVVHAEKEPGPPDPALQGLQKVLEGSFKRYKRFSRLDEKALEVKEGGKGAMKLPDGKDLALEYLGTARGFVKVHLTLDGLKTTVDVKDGGLFFQAGRVYQGGILVLAISAKTKG